MLVKIFPFFEVIFSHKPKTYFNALNWAWFLKQIAPFISNGSPALVTKSQFWNPKDVTASTSFFIEFSSDFFVVYT